MAGITLAQAQAQLDLWIAASSAVAASQSYSIAGRSLSRVDAGEIREQITYWNSQVERLTRASSGYRRTRFAVFE